VDVAASQHRIKGPIWVDPFNGAVRDTVGVRGPNTCVTITMPKALTEQLAIHMTESRMTRDGLVFTAPMGGPIRRSLFRRRMWLPGVQASVGEPLRFHDLRHTHVALLVAAGQHIKVIQERLGHASIRTTLDTYGHLFDGLDQVAAEALDKAIEDQAVGLAWG